MKRTQSIYQLTFFVVLFAAFAGYQFMSANAPANPPSNNVDAPINTGSNTQTKAGRFNVGSTTVNGSLVSDNHFVFGGVYVTSDSPRIKFTDETAGENPFWMVGDHNNLTVYTDRDGDGADASPHPMVVHTGAARTDDYTAFPNKIRAKEYCDENGGNCMDVAAGVSCKSVPYIRTIAITFTGRGTVNCSWNDFSCMANYCHTTYGGRAGYHAAAFSSGGNSISSFSCYDWDVTSTCDTANVTNGNLPNLIGY